MKGRGAVLVALALLLLPSPVRATGEYAGVDDARCVGLPCYLFFVANLTVLSCATDRCTILVNEAAISSAQLPAVHSLRTYAYGDDAGYNLCRAKDLAPDLANCSTACEIVQVGQQASCAGRVVLNVSAPRGGEPGYVTLSSNLDLDGEAGWASILATVWVQQRADGQVAMWRA